MKKKAEALKIVFTLDTIKKTPNVAFLRMQFSVNGIYCTSKYSTGIKCLRTQWHKPTETILDNAEDTEKLKLIKEAVIKKYLQLCEDKPHTSANDLYLHLTHKVEKKEKKANLSTITEVLHWYAQQKAAQEKTYQNKTLYKSKYKFWCKYLKENKIRDNIKYLNSDFLQQFYEKYEKKYTHNYLLILCGFFKSAFSLATDKEIIPYTHLQKLNKGGIEATRTEEYLSAADYEKLKNFVFNEKTKFQNKILTEAKDIYVFMCETGFCYIDYKTFSYADHVKEIKGDFIICKKRHKLRRVKNDNTVSQRGLLTEKAREILQKYNHNLPKVNYENLMHRLKKVAKIVGVPSFISRTHSARHSAGMLLLNEGLHIEHIQGFMGHKNLSTTQNTYAVAEATKIAEAMKKVKK